MNKKNEDLWISANDHGCPALPGILNENERLLQKPLVFVKIFLKQ
jgi:hypothetical protein